jgi:hypothetical protein
LLGFRITFRISWGVFWDGISWEVFGMGFHGKLGILRNFEFPDFRNLLLGSQDFSLTGVHTYSDSYQRKVASQVVWAKAVDQQDQTAL